MNRYCLEYKDASDPGSPAFRYFVRAVSSSDALEKFFDGDDGSLRVIRFALAEPESAESRWRWYDYGLTYFAEPVG